MYGFNFFEKFSAYFLLRCNALLRWWNCSLFEEILSPWEGRLWVITFNFRVACWIFILQVLILVPVIFLKLRLGIWVEKAFWYQDPLTVPEVARSKEVAVIVWSIKATLLWYSKVSPWLLIMLNIVCWLEIYLWLLLLLINFSLIFEVLYTTSFALIKRWKHLLCFFKCTSYISSALAIKRLSLVLLLGFGHQFLWRFLSFCYPC